MNKKLYLILALVVFALTGTVRAEDVKSFTIIYSGKNFGNLEPCPS